MSTEPTSLEAKKEALSRETEMYKHAIGEQVNAIKHDAGQISKKVLIAGAGLAVAFLIGRSLMQKKQSKKIGSSRKKSRLLLPAQGHSGQPELNFNSDKTEHESKSPVADLIKQQIAIFLIGIATQKLQDFLNSQRKNDHEPIRPDDTHYTEPIYIS
jgi:hypothetical protein